MSKNTATLDIQTALDTELNRLLSLDLSPEEEEIARRYYSQKERQSMDESAFCGPGHSFPVQSQEDVDNAAGLAGHADNPDAVRACIRSKAKEHGWKLPDSWTKDDNDRTDAPIIVRADGSHDPFTGKHTHAHPAYGSQGDDGAHEHSHAHDNDADHHHSHDTEKADTPDITRSMPSEAMLYAPIMRIDRDRREVVLRATAEAFDSYGTVIGFDGSKQAFGKWRGNIREMHDPTKAVGRALKYEPVEEEKAIDLTLRVSKGAEDTWQKVLDGTLAGGSIGARNGVWGKRTVNGKEVPFLERYDLVEVSLVDNPSCPGCDIKIVRSDNLATDVLDFSEETPQPEQQADITRVGARISTNTMMSMHKARDHAALGLREQLAGCSCDECQSALNILDPDGDGDVDILASLDTDHDGAGQAGGSGEGIMKFVQTEITRHLAPVIQRFNGIAAMQAASGTHTTTTTIQEPDPELTRRFESLEQKLSGLDEVRSLAAHIDAALGEVKHLAEQIAAQPQPGGPIVNSAALRSQVPDQPMNPLSEYASVVAQLARAGVLNHNQQIEAALVLERNNQQRQVQATRR